MDYGELKALVAKILVTEHAPCTIIDALADAIHQELLNTPASKPVGQKMRQKEIVLLRDTAKMLRAIVDYTHE